MCAAAFNRANKIIVFGFVSGLWSQRKQAASTRREGTDPSLCRNAFIYVHLSVHNSSCSHLYACVVCVCVCET